ncbi:hypothetical protein TWF192_004186 [Orbilia oligospora]|uniref:Uncharacterized protein n=1 Tax=Orbilia oligospora TaxID=2813651 RepID=A0A6G1MP66_ORBOL|nr:hypothetical protein TWF679_007359 [Orbilia oligospora]KAF3220863.1 hypothetical protein TWF191_007322 [Orbilia oligospora]KAF3264504.1 hypothetical protein TWF192_004186 [Orbilia oligospora]
MADSQASENATDSNTLPRQGPPKRRREDSGLENMGLQDDENQAGSSRPPPKRSAVDLPEKPEEPEEPEEPPRLKEYRSSCPSAVEQRIGRVRRQRMFCLGRERDEENLREEFKIAGSTGNVYTVVLENIPTCDCPDSNHKNEICKHILFVMIKVLRVRDELSYQAALLNSEIREIFETSSARVEVDTSEDKRQRKPLDADECPVCYEPFQQGERGVLFCVAQCGSNIHRECFRQWAAVKVGNTVTCVMCRTPWEESSADRDYDYEDILQNATRGREGYLNVGQELGMGSRRDRY